MEYIVAFALFLHLIIYPGLDAVVVTSANSPAAVHVGQNVTLMANPNITIDAGSWSFNSDLVVFFYPPDKVILSEKYKNKMIFNRTDYSLMVISAQVDDSGDYILNGAEPFYRKKLTLSIQVPVSSVSLTVSATNLVEFNDSVTLNCSGLGTPLRYQWINNTAVVTAKSRVQFNDDRSSLTIEGVSRFDEGPFLCNVSNDLSYEESRRVVFNISYGPSNVMMEVSPDKMVYMSGSSVNLSCFAESKPAASYTWLFDGTALNMFGNHLQLTNLQSNQSGGYTCLIHNSVTLRYSEISRRLRFVDSISAVEVRQGGGPPILNNMFKLSCVVTGPVETIRWMMNDNYLPQDNSTFLSDGNKTLTFSSVDTSDNGGYRCIATNVVSSKTSMVYNVTVNYGPNMPLISGPSIVATGSTIQLSCSADSMPPANYTWYFGLTMVAEGANYRMDFVRRNNSGNYTCSASNDITNVTKKVTKEIMVIDLITSVDVRVSGPPPVDKKQFMLTCEAQGTVYDRHWMMDDMELQLNNRTTLSSDNSTLTFDPVLRSDNGDYKCTASNPLSNHTSQGFDLLVNYGPMTPVIAGPMHPVSTGYMVTLNCSADSRPPCTYAWYFRNANGSAELGSGRMLMIEEATPSNSGIYTCVATNNVTKLSSNASKELIVIDIITAVMVKDIGLPPILNMTFTLSCNVTGPVDSIHWSKNGSYLHSDGRRSFSDGNKTLTFSQVMESDNGHYQCSASNAVSSLTSPVFQLKVNYGPQNMDIVGPSTVATGTNVSFTCFASSWPPSTFTWSVSGSNVATTQVFMKDSVTPADSGVYTCTAHNNVTGYNNSATKMLTVIDRISQVVVEKADGPPLMNKTFDLSCNVTGPVDYIYWMKDGDYLYSDDRISTSDRNTTLTFQPVNRSDDGNYQCVAMNAVSNLTSPEHPLLVNYGPWETVMTASQVKILGSNVTLHCSVDSWPPSVFMWYFNQTMVGELPWLELDNLTLADSGNYTCKTHNAVTGLNSSASTHLQVVAPLTIVTVDAGDQLPVLDRMFELTCSANSETTSMYWTKDGVMLSGNSSVDFSESNATMTIESVTHEDKGMYKCTAINQVSQETSPEYYLRVNFGPDDVSISGPELAETEDRVVFNCSASSWPPSVFSWYFNDTWVGNGSQYTTGPLSLEDGGNYTCMAYNNVTEMNSSASVELKVVETISYIMVKPNPVVPEDSEDFSLSCDIGGPYNSIQWLRDSRPLVFNSSMTISNDSKVVSFKPLTVANDGKYQCVASNILKEHVSKAYNLLASYGPSHVKITMTTQNPLTLKCLAASQPPSTYEWLIDGEVKGTDGKITLSILEALGSIITCQAKNPLTNVTVSATFVVPDIGAASPFQSQLDLALTVILPLSLSLLGSWIY
ncbi:hypothetical protein ACEWY4_019742 [Coilia grayii]|uniref:Ig-like domain-containing protein n=1 Tax=Coilia grayii TaxID=363190 RepID=A0ABD1JAY1_9TELE